jgi:hypothetical protein
MARDATWTNSDGLVVGFGTHSADNNVPVVTGTGTLRTYQVELPDATALEATASITSASIPPQSVVIPHGSYIKSATFQVTEAFTTSASGNLDIGLWSKAATPVLDDIDGIDAAIDILVLDAIGDVVVCDGALVGGVLPVGKVNDADNVVVFGYETGIFTAGAGILTMEVIVPFGSTGGTILAT